MKKKILLAFLMVTLFACLFALSIGAEGPKDLFSDVTVLENINKTTTFGYGETDFSRIVMVNPSKSDEYITYPTYYIFGKRDHKTEKNQPTLDLSYLNTATGRAGTEGEFKAEHIICIELPDVFTGISLNYTKTNTMTNLQYIRFSKNMELIHSSAFKNLANLSVIEFEDNTEEGAALNITSYAFDNCDALVRVDFPVHLKQLGERSFGDNALLEEVNFAPGTDFTLYNDDGTVKNNTVFAAFINDTALKSIRLPEGITSTGNLACGSCTSLEYVYIPASCKSIDAEAFNNCYALKTIEFAPNSQLEAIGKKAIAESSVLESIIFPNSFLTTSGEAPLRNLKNVTFINFGASFTGFTGYASMYSTTNKDLVIVLPSCFDTKYAGEISSSATVLFTGTKEQAEKFGYTTVQSYDEWIEAGSPTGKKIVYGYNICTAFYGGEHDYTYEGSFQNECASRCGRCEKVIANDNPSHKLTTVITYENGYLVAGNKYVKCNNAGCVYEDNFQAKPLILFAGISTNNDNTGICVKYAVDKVAIKEYREAGNTFKYGVVACVPQQDNNLEVINPDLTNASDYNTIAVEVDESYVAFDFVMKGFGEKHYETALVMCAYVTDGESVDYINTRLVAGEKITVSQEDYATTITLKSLVEYYPPTEN